MPFSAENRGDSTGAVPGLVWHARRPSRQVLWSRCAGNCGAPQLQFFDEVGIPVVVQRQVPWSAWQSSWTKVAAVPVVVRVEGSDAQKTVGSTVAVL